MTSKIKVDNINKVSDDSNIISKCGTTTTIGSGASNPIVVDGSTVTLGRCGGTVSLASGATQSGFGRSGSVNWDTTPKTTTFTAANGEGYFVNTASGAITCNLPAGSPGHIVAVNDYTNNFATYNLTISPNGTDKITGINSDAILSTEGQTVTLVYVDGLEGWKTIQDSTTYVGGRSFLQASVTGACNTLVTAPCCANVKIATFFNPGCFSVTGLSSVPAENSVGYMLVAGGGAGGSYLNGGGGGGGGYREGRNVPIDNYTASPLVADVPTNAATVTVQTYPISIGGGGAGSPAPVSGTVTTALGLTAAGGGRGGTSSSPTGNYCGQPGGSGGGGNGICMSGGNGGNGGCGGAGNTPPTTPPQGSNGGASPGNGGGGSYGGAAGGGATAAGPNASGKQGGTGGAGATNSISGASVGRAGGGGGSTCGVGPGSGSTAPGQDGGGAGGLRNGGSGSNATINTGGGGGGGNDAGATGNGGSGIVIIRYKFQ